MSDLNDDLLDSVKGNSHRICGILEVESGKLMFVHLDMDATEMQYDLEEYTDPQYVLVTLDVILI
jgi:hypothetical protein